MKKSLVRGMAVAALPVLLAALTGTASARPANGSASSAPPSAFEADSASFVSARTGFVLGARDCKLMPCKARLERTTNGGRSWKAMPVPNVKLAPLFSTTPKSAVSSVTFANAKDGWLYDPGLWATTDGGQKWRRISVPGDVVAIAASDGVAFASVRRPTGSFSAKLYKSRVGSAKWTVVPRVAAQFTVTVYGHSVWSGNADFGSGLWRSTDSGRHWSRLSFHCPAAAGPDASAVAAASPSRVAIVCSNPSEPVPGASPKVVYTSANGGRTFHRTAGEPPTGGNVLMDVPALAMPKGKPRTMTLVAASGATYLYRSTNGGKTWHTLQFSDAGVAVRDLAYVTGQAGYLVHFSGGPAIATSLGLMKTLDTGAIWKDVKIP